MTVSVLLSYPAAACFDTNLTGLEEFNNYNITVRAVNAIGSSDPSIGVTAETNAAGSYSALLPNLKSDFLEPVFLNRPDQMTAKW